MNLFFFLLSLLGFCLLSFYSIVLLIMLWTGCSQDEAQKMLQKKLWNALQKKATTDLSADSGFVNEVNFNLSNVLGEQRYKQLVDLNNTMISPPLLYFGTEGCVPFVGFSVFYTDENEKTVLQSILTNITQKYLRLHGYTCMTETAWGRRSDLKMPVFKVFYARNHNEENTLNIMREQKRKQIVQQYEPIVEDLEEHIDGWY